VFTDICYFILDWDVCGPNATTSNGNLFDTLFTFLCFIDFASCIILDNDQLNTQLLYFYSTFIMILYMFRALYARNM